MTHAPAFVSVFDQVFDTVVFGAGYAGIAASRKLTSMGQSVLLVDRLGDAAWESGRAMAESAGQGEHLDFDLWLQHLSTHAIVHQNLVAPAPAEVLASHHLQHMPGLQVLYYASPVDLTLENNLITHVTLATKSGLRRIAAAQFLDATETGELLCLLPGAPSPRTPATQLLSLYFLHHAWPDDLQPADQAAQSHPIACPALPGASLSFTRASWPNVRKLLISLPSSLAVTQSHSRSAWLPALQALRDQLPALMADAILTHGSVVPLPIYDGASSPQPLSLPANVACASPAHSLGTFDTLGSRFALGALTASRLADQPKARVSPDTLLDAIPPVTPRRKLTAAIAIAGLGTGGLLAAIAAGRHTQNVIAFDPLPYAGGIGTGGGIHFYYHGVKGGLQEELDNQTRQIMPLFGPIPQIRGFHPDAKKITADSLLAQAGVTVLTGSLVCVTTRNGSVQTALISTPAGPVEITASAWIDSTGDGDLCAQAGASFQLGRAPDGQLHAFSQSSGRAGINKGVAQMYCMNYDAGFVDPTDPQDLTRARLLGINHYLHTRYTPDDHPTYIAPSIGLRQARQIDTDYVLTLEDLIHRHRFHDCVGYTGCHYDNHAIDYELESDQAMFWVWICRQWSARTACEIPYRTLLPQSLNNVWIACRALGVSIEAHSSMRMQRDIQRIGEVSGLAAALAVKHAVSSRDIPFESLAQLLAASGAVKLVPSEIDTFGPAAFVEHFTPPINLADPASLAQWAMTLEQNNNPQSELWYLYRAGPRLAGPFVTPLLHSADPDVSFHAAAILAMWADPQAQPRLIQAIQTREYGFASLPESQRPERYSMAVPRWLSAIALLRICGDTQCLASLHHLASDASLVLNARTSIAVTCQHIAQRVSLLPAHRDVIAGITDALLASQPPVEAGPPRRVMFNTTVQTTPSGKYWQPIVLEDSSWQMHLQIARARIAIGAGPHERALQLLADPRVTVRRAAKAAFENAQLAVPIA
jgi:hypothetical protein